MGAVGTWSHFTAKEMLDCKEINVQVVPEIKMTKCFYCECLSEPERWCAPIMLQTVPLCLIFSLAVRQRIKAEDEKLLDK